MIAFGYVIIFLGILTALPGRFKRYFSFLVVLVLAGVSGFVSYKAMHDGYYYFPLGEFGILGELDLKVDFLSAIFLLMINLISVCTSLYAVGFLKKFTGDNVALNLHLFAFNILHVTMLLLCMVDNILIFIILWEIMSFASFVLIIFDFEKGKNLKTAINYLLQMHVGVVFLMIALIILEQTTGHVTFSGLKHYFVDQPNFWMFLLFFMGFGFKMSFVPLHTWAADNYSIAPPHAAALMSGVMKKLGFYGLIRVLMSVQSDFQIIGIFLLLIGLMSGLYGIISSIMQKDLKKTLAFSSVENVGIISIGLGMSFLGYAIKDYALAFLGMSGALLHIFNHALFKSLLFLTAGDVEYSTGTTNINELGGLMKKMPYTGFLFLIGSLSICGLPPFNGFISEFLLYNGIFEGLNATNVIAEVMLLLSLIILSLLGGLSIYNYTKAFGLTFLGTPRSTKITDFGDVPWKMIAAQAIIVLVILSVDLFPGIFIQAVNKVITDFTHQAPIFSQKSFNAAQNLGFVSIVFLAIILVVFGLRSWFTYRNKSHYGATWGCGYVGSDVNLQYTATSYSDYLTSLAEPMVSVKTNYKEIASSDIFPVNRTYDSKVLDPIHKKWITKPVVILFQFMKRFAVVQTGQTQYYILYGFLFILILFILTFLKLIK